MNAALIYWSRTGNTAQVARVIEETLHDAGLEVTTRTVAEATDLDWFDYDLVCLGFPSYHWSPPKPVDDLLRARGQEYRRQGRIQVGAPHVPGKRAILFCTYSGPHTGIDEAIPACKYAGQYFAHVGIEVIGELYVVGEFHGSEEMSTRGPLGDIRGRPNAEDLQQVRQQVSALLEQVASATGSSERPG